MAERIDHRLAANAATVVPFTVDDELHRRLVGLPAMIMTSGLAATGAFLLARDKSGKSEGPRPYRDAAKALLEDAAEHARITVNSDDPNKTLSNIVASSGHRYLIAEARARMFAIWLARIAAARREKKEPTADGASA